MLEINAAKYIFSESEWRIRKKSVQEWIFKRKSHESAENEKQPQRRRDDDDSLDVNTHDLKSEFLVGLFYFILWTLKWLEGHFRLQFSKSTRLVSERGSFPFFFLLFIIIQLFFFHVLQIIDCKT